MSSTPVYPVRTGGVYSEVEALDFAYRQWVVSADTDSKDVYLYNLGIPSPSPVWIWSMPNEVKAVAFCMYMDNSIPFFELLPGTGTGIQLSSIWLGNIQASIYNGGGKIVKEQYRTPLVNKLDAVKNMINKPYATRSTYQGAIAKIRQDIMPHVLGWSDPNHYKTTNRINLIDLAATLLKYPKATFNVSMELVKELPDGSIIEKFIFKGPTYLEVIITAPTPEHFRDALTGLICIC